MSSATFVTKYLWNSASLELGSTAPVDHFSLEFQTFSKLSSLASKSSHLRQWALFHGWHQTQICLVETLYSTWLKFLMSEASFYSLLLCFFYMQAMLLWEDKDSFPSRLRLHGLTQQIVCFLCRCQVQWVWLQSSVQCVAVLSRVY